MYVSNNLEAVLSQWKIKKNILAIRRGKWEMSVYNICKQKRCSLPLSLQWITIISSSMCTKIYYDYLCQVAHVMNFNKNPFFSVYLSDVFFLFFVCCWFQNLDRSNCVCVCACKWICMKQLIESRKWQENLSVRYW